VSSRRPLRAALTGSDTGKAAGLAGASLLNNAIQLVFTIAITRLLGKADYSALAAVVSAFLVLLVCGQSVQAAAAREVALGRLGDDATLLGTVGRWTRTLLVATVVKETGGTERGVKLMGPVHGVLFLVYALLVLLVASDEKWRLKRTLLTLLCAVLPFGGFVADAKLIGPAEGEPAGTA